MVRKAFSVEIGSHPKRRKAISEIFTLALRTEVALLESARPGNGRQRRFVVAEVPHNHWLEAVLADRPDRLVCVYASRGDTGDLLAMITTDIEELANGLTPARRVD